MEGAPLFARLLMKWVEHYPPTESLCWQLWSRLAPRFEALDAERHEAFELAAVRQPVFQDPDGPLLGSISRVRTTRGAGDSIVRKERESVAHKNRSYNASRGFEMCCVVPDLARWKDTYTTVAGFAETLSMQFLFSHNEAEPERREEGKEERQEEGREEEELRVAAALLLEIVTTPREPMWKLLAHSMEIERLLLLGPRVVGADAAPRDAAVAMSWLGQAPMILVHLQLEDGSHLSCIATQDQHDALLQRNGGPSSLHAVAMVDTSQKKIKRKKRRVARKPDEDDPVKVVETKEREGRKKRGVEDLKESGQDESSSIKAAEEAKEGGGRTRGDEEAERRPKEGAERTREAVEAYLDRLRQAGPHFERVVQAVTSSNFLSRQ